MNSYKIKISNSHVNNKKQINDFSIINLLQNIEGTHISELSTFSKYLNDNNLGVFLLYRQVDIIRRVSFGEEVSLTTYPYNTKRSGGYRHIYMLDSNNEEIVKTIAFGAYVNLDTFRPTRLPEDVINTIKDGKYDSSIIDLGRKIKYEITNNLLINEVVVKKSHIDRYNHVNNAHYLSFALDGLDDFYYDRIRVSYIKSFILGDKVKAYLNIQEDLKKVVVLTNELEEIYAIMEFSTINEANV